MARLECKSAVGVDSLCTVSNSDCTEKDTGGATSTGDPSGLRLDEQQCIDEIWH